MKIAIKLVIVFLAIAVIPMLFVGYLSLSNAESYLRQSALENLKIIADSKESDILGYLEYKKGRTIEFASDGFIKDETERISKIKDAQERKEASKALNTHLKVNKKPLDPDILEIHIIDLEGRIIGSTDEEELGEDKEKAQQYFLRGQKETYIQDMHIYAHEGNEEGVIAIGTPLLSRADNRIIGVLMSRYKLSDIQEVMSGKRARRLGALTTIQDIGTREIFLANQQGFMLTPLKQMGGFRTLNRNIDALEPVAKCMQASEEINKDWSNLQGNKVLGASMCPQVENDWKWILVVEQDEKEVLALVAKLRNLVIMIGIITLFLVVAASFSVSRTISAPIQSLTKSITDISMGKLDAELEQNMIKRDDEIGDLAKAFDRTIVSLKLAMKKAGTKPKPETEEKKVNAEELLTAGLIKKEGK